MCDLRVIERSLLVQQIRPRKSTGLTVSGDWENFDYELGVFSGELDPEFGGNDGGLFYLASIGYDFTDLIDGWEDFDLLSDEYSYPIAGAFVDRLLKRGGKEKFLAFFPSQTYAHALVVYGPPLEGWIEEFEGDLFNQD